MQLNVQEQGRFIQDWRGGNFEAFASLNSGGPDPDDYFGRTFATGGATNVFKYSNPEPRQAARRGARHERPGAAQDAVRRGAAHAGLPGAGRALAYGTLFTAIRADVQGFQPSPTRSLRGLRETTHRASNAGVRGGQARWRAGLRRVRRLGAHLPDDPADPGRRRADHAGRRTRTSRRSRSPPCATSSASTSRSSLQYLALARRARCAAISAPASGRASRCSQEIAARRRHLRADGARLVLAAIVLAVPLGCLMATCAPPSGDYTVRDR